MHWDMCLVSNERRENALDNEAYCLMKTCVKMKLSLIKRVSFLLGHTVNLGVLMRILQAQYTRDFKIHHNIHVMDEFKFLQNFKIHACVNSAWAILAVNKTNMFPCVISHYILLQNPCGWNYFHNSDAIQMKVGKCNDSDVEMCKTGLLICLTRHCHGKHILLQNVGGTTSTVLKQFK